MKNYLCLVLIFIVQFTQAQISVDRSFMPNVGEKVFYTSAENDNSTTYELSGDAVVWDYSSLKLSFQSPEEYKRARDINFFFFSLDYGVKVFDSLGFGMFVMKDIYDIYDVSNTAFTAAGRSIKYNGFPIPQNYKDEDEVYQFPLNYKDQDTSTFNVSFSLAGQFKIVQDGIRINNVEGWGKLILPHKTYENCLKVKTTIQETDSIKVAGISLPPFSNNRVEYKWFATGYKNPVLIVSGSLIANRFTVTEVKYQEPEKEIIGFYASTNSLPQNKMLMLVDTSAMEGLFREWEVIPSTFELELGSNAGDSVMSVSFNEIGLYSVSLTKRNRFGTKTITKTDYIEVTEEDVSLTSLSNSKASKTETLVYPNPFKNTINLFTSDQLVSYKLKNQLGKTVLGGKESTIKNLEHLPKGVYFIELSFLNEFETIKLVKE